MIRVIKTYGGGLQPSALKQFRAVPSKRCLWALVGIFCLLFVALISSIPPVWTLDDGQIEVTRWRHSIGRVRECVGPKEPQWRELSEVSLHVVNASIVSEDSRFYQHPGIDLTEIWRSLLINVRDRRYSRGASTITQQVVKMAFLSQEKKILRKIREILGALVLETIMEKQEILAWYLNMVELGDGVYGFNEAARHYFNTDVEILTVAQAVHLVLVLPSPNKWSKGLRQERLTKFGHIRFGIILHKLLTQGAITPVQFQVALKSGDFGRPILNESKKEAG